MATIWDTLFPKQDYRTAAPSGGYADMYANGLLGNRTDTPSSVKAMETGKDFIPVLSDVLAFGEAGHALSEGDRKTAAILAAGGLLGAIPAVGPALARPVMAAGRKAADVASRIEVDPNAVGSMLGNVRFNKEALEVASKQSDRSREILVNMPINDFLKAAKKEVSQAKLSGTRRLIENGETFDTVPSLAFVNNGDGTGKVVGHDGRHRAIALREAGEDTIPVLLSNQAGDGPSIRYGVQNDPNDRDYVDILPKTLIEEDGSGFVEMPSAAFDPSQVSRVAPPSPAEEIAGLLSSGRADDVTDEMLGKLTAQDNSELFELYQSGATGMDLPMDEASRMARAAAAGFDVNKSLYHGTNSDINGFSGNVFSSDSPTLASTYNKGLEGAGIYPIMTKSKLGDTLVEGGGAGWSRLNVSDVKDPAVAEWLDWAEGQKISTREIEAAASREGRSGVQFEDIVDTGAGFNSNKFKNLGYTKEQERALQKQYMEDLSKPSNVDVRLSPNLVRSKFARFDPRLANLKNLSAGVGAAPIGLLALREEQKRANEEQYKRGLLQ